MHWTTRRGTFCGRWNTGRSRSFCAWRPALQKSFRASISWRSPCLTQWRNLSCRNRRPGLRKPPFRRSAPTPRTSCPPSPVRHSAGSFCSCANSIWTRPCLRRRWRRCSISTTSFISPRIWLNIWWNTASAREAAASTISRPWPWPGQKPASPQWHRPRNVPPPTPEAASRSWKHSASTTGIRWNRSWNT